MSEILANQWRPQSFDEVIGQSTIVKALTNALDQSLLHHCYLFSGTRGVGKTSLARLFAQGLNCAEKMTSNPCKQCDSCIGIKNGADLDCYEIDAASRTKVEETLKILEMANYPPTRSRYKIFLIDEVHMLSNHSFNALLKTLEQPPSYVKFLLATTEPARIPDTVRSRCIQFKLQPVVGDTLSQHILKVVKSANKSIDDDAINLLVQVANGSVRDAMTSLQHILLQSGDQTITIDQIENTLGLVSALELQKLKTIIASNDHEQAQQWCDRLSKSQFSWSKLLDQWLSFLNELMWHNLKKDDDMLQNWIQIALLAKKDLALYPTAKMAFQVMIARSIHFVPKSPDDWMDGLEVNEVTNGIAEKKTHVETVKGQKTTILQTSESKQNDKEIVKNNEKIQKNESPNTGQDGEPKLPLTNENWPVIAEQMNLSGMTNQLLQHIVFVSKKDKAVVFSIVPDKASLKNEKAINLIEQRLKDMGYDVKLTIELNAEVTNKNIDQVKTEKRQQVFNEKKQYLNANEDFKRICSVLDAEVIN
ncbi:MAG: DNA polymerase III subunit gamma/tau [Pseudomonadota bacterium]|nr:DNA polymerase III subunit gamma/tau [Pseudomonadota bacterium]